VLLDRKRSIALDLSFPRTPSSYHHPITYPVHRSCTNNNRCIRSSAFPRPCFSPRPALVMIFDNTEVMRHPRLSENKTRTSCDPRPRADAPRGIPLMPVGSPRYGCWLKSPLIRISDPSSLIDDAKKWGFRRVSTPLTPRSEFLLDKCHSGDDLHVYVVGTHDKLRLRPGVGYGIAHRATELHTHFTAFTQLKG
jgi:hypothetical protein